VSGVGDLLAEFTTLESARIRAEEDARYEQEKREAARTVHQAPMLAALAKQKQGLQKRAIAHKTISAGDVISRGWELYTANFAMALLVAFFVLMTNMIVAVGLILGFAFLGGIVGALLIQVTGTPVAGVVGLGAMIFLGAVASILFSSWLYAGQKRVFLKMAKGKEVEFVEVFQGGRHAMAIASATFTIMVLSVMSIVPLFAPTLFVAIWSAVSSSDPPKTVTGIISIVGVVLFLILLPLSIILVFRFSLYEWAIVDNDALAGEGLGISKQLIGGNVISVLGVYLLCWAVSSVAGFLPLLGMIFTYPLVLCFLAVMYTDLTGQAPRRGEQANAFAPAPLG
jgi:hypothetical protein